MGNPDHMKIILDGDVDTWNLWRSDNLRVQPDLTRIDLSGRDLSKIDFKYLGKIICTQRSLYSKASRLV